MPNIKSAKKRVLVIEKKTQQNKAVKSALKTQVKKFLTAVEAGRSDETLSRNRFRHRRGGVQGRHPQEQREQQKIQARQKARRDERVIDG